MRVAYPVIFTTTDTNILIEVPDLGIITEAYEEGKSGTIADAISMARDAIGIKCIQAQDEGRQLAEASEFQEINLEEGTFHGEGTETLSMVDIDLDEYRRKVDTKTVRRNVTLPSWLNYEAEKAKVNVSRVLQEALMEKLGVQR